MEPEGSLPRLQVPATCSFPDYLKFPRLCRELLVSPDILYMQIESHVQMLILLS